MISPVPVPDMVRVPAGDTLIGSTAEEIDAAVAAWAKRLVDPSYTADQLRAWLSKESPAHAVHVNAFAMARTPVTEGEYTMFVRAAGHRPALSTALSTPADHPVWGISPADADAYVAWLASVAGHPYRLATEIEWEWAARGPERRIHPWGDTFDPRLCNTVEGGPGTTTPVDAYPEGASPFGILDLAGNVEEYVADAYAPYPGGPVVVDDLAAFHPHGYRVLRGGSCALSGDLARGARRHGGPLPPTPRFRYVGLRVALTLHRKV